MKLSKNFTLAEFVKSATAKRKGIDNTPNSTHIARMKVLCEEVLQPARDYFKELYGEDCYIRITSGYRSVELCEALGSSARSFHAFGYAADCELMVKHEGKWVERNNELFKHIKNNLPFTELIDEYDFSWVHVAYNPEDSRKMIKKIG